MCADDAGHESFEERLRSIAREVGRSVERAMSEVDLGEIADSVGVDPDRAREWIDSAGGWLRHQSEMPADEWMADTGPRPGARDPRHSRSGGPERDPLPSAAPHPLDLPTEDQGLALAALDSGRWSVEPGSNALAAQGDGPGPSDALGLVRELRARDWIKADGEVTVVGLHALGRWLDSSTIR